MWKTVIDAIRDRLWKF